MGVPAFFRKLVKKYPSIVSSCIEAFETGGAYSEDPSEPNPNCIGDREFDCLYLDMNGIIHPCFHPSGSTPKSEEEIFSNIELYILRLFSIVRPRRLLFLAIDGPAPRAKINQQRMRRYRSSKEAAFNRWIDIWRAKKEENQAEVNALSQPDYLSKNDSNVITPGTPFMERLGNRLKLFIKKQQREETAWKDIKIILSDSSVPGEGEHKIFYFIRSQRTDPDYDPNTRHCIYGLDADLLFLSLATHEQYISVIRERIVDEVKMPEESELLMKPYMIGPDKFNFVSIWVLREYLNRDLRSQEFDRRNLGFNWNLEKAIDDFILLSFSSGNDFLPSLVGFSFGSGSMPQIISVYRDHLPRIGYISDRGFVDPEKLRDYMIALSEYRARGRNNFEKTSLLNILRPCQASIDLEKEINFITNNLDPNIDNEPPEHLFQPPKNSKENLKNYPPCNIDGVDLTEKTDLDVMKKIYYKHKFHKLKDRKYVLIEFMKGMMWTLKYYTHGVPSWEWFYPYHNSPLMSDFKILSKNDFRNITDDFTKNTKPYQPLYQLMAVLPPASAHALPRKLAQLMTDPKSVLKNFYPRKFNVELNGQTIRYLGHPVIDFIDGDFLKKTLDEIDLELTEDEERRNSFNLTSIFIPVDKPKLDENDKCDLSIKEHNIIAHVFLPKDKDYETTTEFHLRFINVDFNKDLSYILPNTQIPPRDIVYEEQFDSNGKETDIEQLRERLMNFPLEIPGTHVSQIWKDREEIIERLKNLGKLPPDYVIKRRKQ